MNTENPMEVTEPPPEPSPEPEPEPRCGMDELSNETPRVQFIGVHGRDERGRQGRQVGSLSGVTMSLHAGVHVVLGTPSDGTVALADMVGGRLAPRVGSVFVNGQPPTQSSRSRLCIGSLLVEPELPCLGSVKQLLALVGIEPDAVADAGLMGVMNREVASLRRDELRSLELQIALAMPSANVWILYEPLRAMAVTEPSAVLATLSQLARAGGCVVIVTPTLAGLEPIAEHVHTLREGHLTQDPPLSGWLEQGPQAFEVQTATSEDARRLAVSLTEQPQVMGVRWDAVTALVQMHADSCESGARAIAHSVATTDVHVVSLVGPPNHTRLGGGSPKGSSQPTSVEGQA